MAANWWPHATSLSPTSVRVYPLSHSESLPVTTISHTSSTTRPSSRGAVTGLRGRGGAMSDEMTITVDSEEYVLRREGDSLKVGRRMGDDTTWLDDVDLATLPADARIALERGNTSDAALELALRGVVAAEVRRGGRAD